MTKTDALTRDVAPARTQATYEPQQYWERLLSTSFDMSGVAYAYLAVSFNRAMYRAERDVVQRALTQLCPSKPIDSALDVGCGTGIWLNFWRRRGVPSVTGLDLTEASISRLRSLDISADLVQADISSPDLELGRQFDVISAMSVLLHVVEPARFSAAVRNLARHLAPGGVLLMVEPVIVNRWWGEDFGPHANSRARTADEWTHELAAHGLEVVDLRPVTFLLANPIDARRHFAMRLWWRYWSYILRFVGRRERVGAAVGRVLELPDRLLRRALRPGPSAKLLVVRHRGGSNVVSANGSPPQQTG